MPQSRLLAVILLSALTLAGCSHAPRPVQPYFCTCAPAPYLSLPIFFASDSAVLSHRDTLSLNEQAKWFINSKEENILIAGNADERGTEVYNLALGQRRADAARDYLLASGMASSGIKTISYGKDRPFATGHDEKSWRLNRNALISLQSYDPQACLGAPDTNLHNIDSCRRFYAGVLANVYLAK